jgi:predicted acylesterase/phospholipase RssA
VTSSKKQSRSSSGPRIGLALAGGGPEGAVFEIGALRALDESLQGLDLTDLEIYVGVSAGSFLSACLANGLTTAQLCRAIVKQQMGEHPFVQETFFTPAVGEFVRRGFQVPGLVLESLREYLLRPWDMTLLESFGRLARALPVGMFDNEPIRLYLKRIFSLKDRTDDFRKLGGRLIVVAADLDSGTAVRFGEPGFDHVSISTAVQASTAVPGVYPPVEIDGRYFVDGALLKTLHASVALDAGVDLLLCINPIVPVDTSDAVEAGAMRHANLVRRGLPTVMSQTFRTLVRSRLAAGFASYEPLYPEQDIVLIEPRNDDYRMFFTNIFSFSSRKAVCEHAYQVTRRLLLDHREEWEPILQRHGVRYRMDVLLQRERTVWDAVGRPDGPSGLPVTDRLDEALARLEAILEDEVRSGRGG